MQMRHIKTSLLEVMMNFQGDLPNDQEEDDGTKLEPFFRWIVRWRMCAWIFLSQALASGKSPWRDSCDRTD